MAKEQKPFERGLITPTQTVQGGNAFDQMGKAAGDLSQVLSSKATDIAIEQAGQQGALDATQGDAPDSLMPPLTKATKAYNNAVSETEAVHMVTSAQEQIQESLLKHSDPRNFSAETPAQFRAEMTGIINGTLENARDSNRPKIQAALEKVEASAATQMLKTSIQHDNRVINNDFKNDVDSLETQLKSAFVANDEQAIQDTEQALEATFTNYGIRSEAINEQLPQIRKQLEETRQVYQVLGDYSKSISEGRDTRFLADFVENKEKLPINVYQKAAKELLTLNDTSKKLRADAAAEDNAMVQKGILNGTITNNSQIAQFTDQTPVQLIRNNTLLQQQKIKDLKDNADIVEARRNILTGHAAVIEGSTKKKLYNIATQNFFSDKGRAMNVFDARDALLGESQYNFSGMPNTPMGTDLPQVNAIYESDLLSSDPKRVANASAAYHSIVTSAKSPNSIKLSGKALSVAKVYNGAIQNGTTTAEEAAQTAINRVMNVSDAERKERDTRFKQIKESQFRSWFKDIFGTKPQDFKTDAAFGNFKDNFYSHYLNANSEQAALEASADEMRAWGTSPHFDDGAVFNNVPEKEVPETKMGYTFDNQIRVKLQAVINRNRSLRQNTNESVHTIEWENKDSNIDLNNLTDNDKVFKLLGKKEISPNLQALGMTAALGPTAVLASQIFGDVAKPRVTVDGVSSDVILIPGPDSRMGNRHTYTLGYYDKYGIPTPIPDATNQPQGVAQFSVSPISEWAPSFSDEQQEALIQQTARRFVAAQDNAEAKARQESASFLQKKFGPDNLKPFSILNYLNGYETPEFKKQVESVSKLLRQKAKNPKEQARKGITQADSVGITMPNPDTTRDNQ